MLPITSAFDPARACTVACEDHFTDKICPEPNVDLSSHFVMCGERCRLAYPTSSNSYPLGLIERITAPLHGERIAENISRGDFMKCPPPAIPKRQEVPESKPKLTLIEGGLSMAHGIAAGLTMLIACAMTFAARSIPSAATNSILMGVQPGSREDNQIY